MTPVSLDTPPTAPVVPKLPVSSVTERLPSAVVQYADKFERASNGDLLLNPTKDVLRAQLDRGMSDAAWKGPLPDGGPKTTATFANGSVVQGFQNACVTASMASMLNFWAGDRVVGLEDVDHIRPRLLDWGTLPGAMVDEYRARGFRAQTFLGTTPDVLLAYVDAGVPVHVLVSAEKFAHEEGYLDVDIPALFDVHAVTVLGVERDASGAPTEVRLSNPWHNFDKTMSWDKFIQAWGTRGPARIFNRTAVVALPGVPTPVMGKDGQVRDASKLPLPWITGSGAAVLLRIPYEVAKLIDTPRHKEPTAEDFLHGR